MRQSDGLRPHRGGGGRKAPPAPAPPPTPAPPALGGEELEGGGVARLAATAFALHLAVLLPRVSSAPGGGDSGELLAVSCDGGVAHPPGYPLFVMLARYPIGWVGIGTPAWRVGVLCACMSAGSTALLLAAVAGATSSLPAGAAAAALAAFSPLLASHAATPEVFPLNQLLAAAMLLCATRFARQVRLPKPNTESRPAAAPSCGKGGALLARRGARVTRAGRHTYSWAFP
mmetsp:Transcript_12715/g.40174  ORF Transcript_12715/g.40174 Transcript_12715/m.40174 type:complete len:230 (+) Transcript_12715:59-748(+)